MRNILIFLLLSFCSVFGFGLDAKVMSVTGKVEVQRGDMWVQLKEGEILPKGSVVSTGFKSEIEIQINDAIVSCGPLTRMTIQQLAENAEVDETSLFMDSGSINTNIERTNGKRVNFKVRNPIATASVRGTEFTMRGNKIICKKGAIAVGKSYSKEAVVSQSNTVSEQMPSDTPTNVATKTEELNGDKNDIPVFAGQSTKIIPQSNNIIPPQIVMVENSRLSRGLTQSLTVSESSASVIAATNTAYGTEMSDKKGKSPGMCGIKVTWGN